VGSDARSWYTALSSAATNQVTVLRQPVVGDLGGSPVPRNRRQRPAVGPCLAVGGARLYDARSARMRWTWDPIPWRSHPAGPGPGAGQRNGSTPFAADPARDLVFFDGQREPRLTYGRPSRSPVDNKVANARPSPLKGRRRAPSCLGIPGGPTRPLGTTRVAVLNRPLIRCSRPARWRVTTRSTMCSLLENRVTGNPRSTNWRSCPCPKSTLRGEEAVGHPAVFPEWNALDPPQRF